MDLFEATKTLEDVQDSLLLKAAPDIQNPDYFVSVYTKDAVYERTEGGYYVSVTKFEKSVPVTDFAEAVDVAADFAEADEFGDTISTEERDAVALRAEPRFLQFGSVQVFTTSGEYPNEGCEIFIESPEDRGANEKHYNGYKY